VDRELERVEEHAVDPVLEAARTRSRGRARPFAPGPARDRLDRLDRHAALLALGGQRLEVGA
jgi:hypothetical protein